MKNAYLKLSNFFIIRRLTSVRIAVVCLILLFILTVWGTIYQVENGLYSAQEKFFHSIFYLIGGFFPFPGGRLVMTILFINLLCVALFRFRYSWPRLGILVIHFGIMLFLISGFVTFYYAVESHLTLAENEGANVSASYHDWELAVWKENDGNRRVVAFDSKKFTSGKVLDFNKFGFQLYVKNYYLNCDAFSESDSSKPTVSINASGVSMLKEVKAFADPAKNMPGGIFSLAQDGKITSEIILYGAEGAPTPVEINDQQYYFMLRYKTHLLPFVLKLIDFRKQIHPGTEIARSFESTVEIQTPELSRQSVISMNNPLRYKDFTFYQSSYSIDPRKGEISTLAVVKNSGRLLPYIASVVTFLGLAIHFLAMIFPSLILRSKAGAKR